MEATMKFLMVVILAALAVTIGAPRPPRRPPVQNYKTFPQSPDDEYAASLAGAPLGLYEKRHGSGGDNRRGWYWGGSEAQGLSLGNAKVGLYGKALRENYNPNWPLLRG